MKFELMKELNELILSIDNPVETATDWLFDYQTYSYNYISAETKNRVDKQEEWLNLHQQPILLGEEIQTEEETLEEILDELESWLPALQSAIWAVKELKKEY